MATNTTSTELSGTPFHEDWWLAAATRNEYQEVTVGNGVNVIGRLPFVIRKRAGFTELRMPPFTHILGPLVQSSLGKSQTQMLRRVSIIRELIDKLPRHSYFKQALDSEIIDGLAFQDRGFSVRPHYTFEIDCRICLDDIWAAMHFKVRQHIRRAEERFCVIPVTESYEFVRFYLDNLERRGFSSNVNFDVFAEVFLQARAHDAGEILSACWPEGKSTAMIYLVWGRSTMYYLMSTRASDAGDNGSINLLIWSAIKHAHRRGLVLDLDGVTTTGTARFLSGFGGRPKARMIVERSSLAYGAIQDMRRWFIKDRRYKTFT
jgi:hypothetical protein